MESGPVVGEMLGDFKSTYRVPLSKLVNPLNLRAYIVLNSRQLKPWQCDMWAKLLSTQYHFSPLYSIFTASLTFASYMHITFCVI